MKFEIIHDTIAKQVFEKASIEARTRRKVEKFIRERFEAHQLRGAKLTQDDLDYIQPYLTQVNISEEESAFLEKNRKSLADARTRIRVIVAGVIIFLLGSTAFSLVQWKDAIEQKEFANTQKEYADEQTLKAIAAQKADSLKAIDLGIALEEAELAKDTAEIARIKAEQEKLRADQAAREALDQKTLAEINAQQTEALAISTIARNIDQSELETSLRVLEAAYLKTFPHAPPPEVQQALTEKFFSQVHKKDQIGFRIAEYFTHKSVVKNYSLSPDQKYLASYADDSTFYLWSANGNLIANPTEHENDITSLYFSPDGSQVLSSSFDGSAKLWNLKGEQTAHMMMVNDGEQLRNRRHRAWFSPNGQHIFTLVSDSLKLWNNKGEKICDLKGKIGARTRNHFLAYTDSKILLYDYQGKSRELLDNKDIRFFAFSPDGNQLLGVNQYMKTTLWNLAGDTLFHNSPLDSITLGASDMRPFHHNASVKFYPKHNRILLFGSMDAAGHSKQTYVLDYAGKVIQHFFSYHTEIMDKLGSILSVNDDSSGLHVFYYNKHGELLKKSTLPTDFVDASSWKFVYLANDRKSLWVNVAGENHGIFKFKSKADSSWIENWSYIVNTERNINVRYSAKSSVGNQYLAVQPAQINGGSLGTRTILNHLGEQVFNLQGSLLQFSKNNKFVFVAEGKQLKKIDLEGTLIKKVRSEYKNVSYKLSPNRNTILSYPRIIGNTISAKNNPPARIYNMNGRKLKEFAFPFSREAPLYSDDLKYIMSLQLGRSLNRGSVIKGPSALLKVFNANGEKVNSLQFGSNGLKNQRFLPNSTSILLSSFRQKSALLWDFNSGKLDSLTHLASINEPVFSPDGKHIITYERVGGLFKLWNQKGELTFEKNLNTKKIASIEFAPDSKSFMVRSYDKIARRYSIRGKVIQKFGPFPDFLRTATFSPKGEYILINYLNKVSLRKNDGSILSQIVLSDHEIYEADFSPSGNYFWTRNDSNEVQIWNMASQLQVQIAGESPVFSPNEEMILTQNEKKEQILWNIKGEQLAIFNGEYLFKDFAPDGKSYLTSYSPSRNPKSLPIQIWDTDGKLLASLPGTEFHRAIGYSQDSKFVWTSYSPGDEVYRWPVPQTIFEFLQNDSRFPQLEVTEKEKYGID